MGEPSAAQAVKDGLEQRQRLLFRNTGMTLLARFILLLLGIASSAILARGLGPEGRGIYTLALLIPTMAVTFAQLGVATSTTYHVAKRTHTVGQVLSSNMLLALLLGAGGGVGAALVVAFFRDAVVPGVPFRLLAVGLLLIPLELVLAYTESILQGLEEFVRYNAVQLLRPLLFIGALLAVFAWLPATPEPVIWLTLLVLVLTDAVVLGFVLKETKGWVWHPSRAYIRASLSFGARSHLGGIMTFLYLRVDMLLLNGMAGAAAVGYYAVAVSIVEKLAMLSQAVGVVLLPRAAADGRLPLRESLTPVLFRAVLTVTALAGVLLWYLARSLVLTLYGSDFADTIQPLQYLLPGIVALAGARVLGNEILGRGHPLVNTVSSGIALAINVAFNLLWIPLWGASGAALASSLAYISVLLFRVLAVGRLTGTSPLFLFQFSSADVALYRTAVTYFGTRLQRRG
ncbi:MAG: oligosaccharide flippase family protein [Candidatus Bipolaricaulota bacterium]